MQKKTKITSKKHTKLHIFVTYVFRANFNDEMYVCEKDIFLDELDGKELVWFDPYLGNSKANTTQIAITRVTDKGFYYLERESGEVKEEKASLYGSTTFSEDYDERFLIASHLQLRS